MTNGLMDVYELTARVLWDVAEKQIKEWMQMREAVLSDEAKAIKDCLPDEIWLRIWIRSMLMPARNPHSKVDDLILIEGLKNSTGVDVTREEFTAAMEHEGYWYWERKRDGRRFFNISGTSKAVKYQYPYTSFFEEEGQYRWWR